MLSQYLDPKNDVAFKKIFGTEKNKAICMHFLNDMLEFTGLQKIEEITFLSTVQDPEVAWKKQSIVDVLCRDYQGTQYIIEMQVAKSRGFEKRAQYYAAQAYTRQARSGAPYPDLKEIIFIAIADCILFPDKKAYKSDHIVLDRETGEHNLKDFYFTFIELPKFTKKPGDALTTLIEQWCYFFKYASQTQEEELSQIVEPDSVIREAYSALNQFYWTEQELLFYEQEMKRTRDAAAILEQQLDDARQEGEQRGEKRGLKKGIKEGEQRGKLAIAKRLLQSKMDIAVIVQITQLPQEQIVSLMETAKPD